MINTAPSIKKPNDAQKGPQIGSKNKFVDQNSSVIAKLAEKMLAATYTKNQMRKRMRLLKDFVNFRSYQNFKEKQNLAQEITAFLAKYPLYNLDAHWLISLGEDVYKEFKELNTTNLLKQLARFLETVPTAVLFLPFELNDEIYYEKTITTSSKSQSIPVRLEVEIGSWFKKNISSTFLFEPSYNPDVIGGVALSWNGVYKDYSLREQVLANRERIINLFKDSNKDL